MILWLSHRCPCDECSCWESFKDWSFPIRQHSSSTFAYSYPPFPFLPWINCPSPVRTSHWFFAQIFRRLMYFALYYLSFWAPRWWPSWWNHCIPHCLDTLGRNWHYSNNCAREDWCSPPPWRLYSQFGWPPCWRSSDICATCSWAHQFAGNGWSPEIITFLMRILNINVLNSLKSAPMRISLCSQ